MNDPTQIEEIIQTQTLDLAPIREYDAKVREILNSYVTHHDRGLPVYGYCIDGPTDAAGLAEAKIARRTVKTLRLAIEATRKDLKKPALEWGNAVDAEAKRLIDLVIQAEAPIDASIKAVEAEKREIKADALAARRELIDARFRALLAVESTLTLATIEELDDGDFEAVLAQETARFEEEEADRQQLAEQVAATEKAAAEKAEADRIAEEERAEEAAEKQRVADAAAQKKRDAEAAEKKKEDDAERERLRAENVKTQARADAATEARRVEREAAEKELAKAKAERDKLQAEKDEADRVALEEEERIATEIAEAHEAKRLAEARPIVERLQEFAEQVRIDTHVPDIGFGLREELVEIMSTAADSVEELAKRVEAGTYAGE